MKYYLSIFFFSFLSVISFARGGSGTYYIKGTAYGTDRTILKTTELKVKIGNETKTIKTDENGVYEIEVHWESACPSGISHRRWEKECEKLNPKYVYVTLDRKEVKIETDWKKYADLFPESKEKVTMKKDLHFV